MLSMFNSAASDGPTLTPVRNKGTLEVISIIPRVILVGMAKAWKKEVFSGPKVVAWAGTATSRGEMAPARAEAGTLKVLIRSRTSFKSPLVMTKPTFCLMSGRSFSRAGLLAAHSRIAFFIMAAHTSTDGLELLRGHIVGVADEDALVLGEEAVGFLEISLFPCLSIPFDHFDMIRAVSDYLRYK